MSDQQQQGSSLPPPENGTNDIHVDSNSGYGENQQISPIHLFNPGTIVLSGTGPSDNSSTTAIYLSQSRPVNTLLTTTSSSVLLRAPNVSDNNVTLDKYIESSITADTKLLDKHVLPHYQRNEVNHSTLSLDLDEVEMNFINDMILSDTDYDFAFDLQVNELKQAQTRSDDITAVAVAAPSPPSSSAPDTNGTNAHENDIWICKETYEAERRRDIDLWLRTLFPPNAKDAFPADDLSGLQEQLDKLAILKKLILLTAVGNLYLVKKNEAIMDTMEDLYGADISIASLFNHGKRIVVQFDGHHQAFLKLQEFLFPTTANLLYSSTCTHNVDFCSAQHHLKESDSSSSSCKRMDFPYGGLGEIHRKDACTNQHKSRTEVGDWFRIVANGERRCTKSGDKVPDMQHGHFLVRVAKNSPKGRFHGFLFGIENTRPWKTFKDGLKSVAGYETMGMFDKGHGPAATKGPASVSGGWKRDRFMKLIGRNPDNMGGIRLHLDTRQVETFYHLYALMAEGRHHYEALLNSPIGTVPPV